MGCLVAVGGALIVARAQRSAATDIQSYRRTPAGNGKWFRFFGPLKYYESYLDCPPLPQSDLQSSSIEDMITDRCDGSSASRPFRPHAGRVVEQCSGHKRRVQVLVRRVRHGHRLFPGGSVLRGQHAKLGP